MPRWNLTPVSIRNIRLLRWYTTIMPCHRTRRMRGAEWPRCFLLLIQLRWRIMSMLLLRRHPLPTRSLPTNWPGHTRRKPNRWTYLHRKRWLLWPLSAHPGSRLHCQHWWRWPQGLVLLPTNLFVRLWSLRVYLGGVLFTLFITTSPKPSWVRWMHLCRRVKRPLQSRRWFEQLMHVG